MLFTYNVCVIVHSSFSENGDYEKLSETLTFDCSKKQCFDVKVLPDNKEEENEVFIVELTYEDGCGVTHQEDTSVIIVDSCSEPVEVSFSQAVYIVNEEDSSVSVCVVVSGGNKNKAFTLSALALHGSSSSYATGIYDCNKHFMYITISSDFPWEKDTSVTILCIVIQLIKVYNIAVKLLKLQSTDLANE